MHIQKPFLLTVKQLINYKDILVVKKKKTLKNYLKDFSIRLQ